MGCALMSTAAVEFISAAAHDFHLKLGSRARDNGVSIAGFSTDIEGTDRLQGVNWDIGAYEYSASRISSPGSQIIL